MGFSWPYRFIFWSEEEKSVHRASLNLNGFYAYLTPITICCAVGLLRLYTLNSKARSSALTPPSGIQRLSRRVQWWLSTPLDSDFGSRQVHIIGATYTIWLLFLGFRQTSDDYLHLTRQLGHVAVSQLPVHYALAIKSPSSPIQGLTGMSHETLLPYHRLFGRIIHLFLLAHGALYMNLFVQNNVLLKRLSSSAVLLGIAAAMMLNILAFNAIPPIRKTAYHNRFYKSHVVMSIVLLPTLFFHVPYTRFYVVQCFVFAAFNAVSRMASTSKPTMASVKLVGDGTNLVRLQIPGPSAHGTATGPTHFPGWVPGQHCYVKQDPSPMMPRSPFTIASTSSFSDAGLGEKTSGDIELVFRNLNGPMTGWLGKKPGETGKQHQNVNVYIEGPYGETEKYVPDLVQSDDGDVLLVAGGVGATFTIPIYIFLLKELAKIKRGRPGQPRRNRNRKIVFVWAVRSRPEIAWGVEMLMAGLAKLDGDGHIDIDIRIYVTNRTRKSGPTSNKLPPAAKEDGVAKATARAPSLATARSPVVVESILKYEKIKVPQPDTELTSDKTEVVDGLAGLKVVEDQRPNLNALVTEVFGCTAPPTPFVSPKSSPKGSPSPHSSRTVPNELRYEKVTVMVCGPKSLGLELRNEVGRHVIGYGREVDFREEVFGHGGT